MYKSENAEEKGMGREEEMELNGVEEEQLIMSDEDGEGEVAAPDWKVRAGPRSKPTQRERKTCRDTRAVS